MSKDNNTFQVPALWHDRFVHIMMHLKICPEQHSKINFPKIATKKNCLNCYADSWTNRPESFIISWVRMNLLNWFVVILDSYQQPMVVLVKIKFSKLSITRIRENLLTHPIGYHKRRYCRLQVEHIVPKWDLLFCSENSGRKSNKIDQKN